MKISFDDYCSRVIKDLLKLEGGEALHINVDEANTVYASRLAQKAANITGVASQLVILQSGRPMDVMSFEPELFAPAQAFTRPVLLHLKGGESYFGSEELGFMARHGHLSDPADFTRTITVPYSVLQAYDDDFEGFAYSLEKENAIQSAQKELNRLAMRRIHIEGPGTDLVLAPLRDSLWISPLINLGSRAFWESDGSFSLQISLDSAIGEGRARLRSSILSQSFDLDLIFKNGRVCNSLLQEEGVKAFLNRDEDLKRSGYLSLEDGSVALALGGGLPRSYNGPSLEDEQVPEGFNSCIYRLVCTLEADRITAVLPDRSERVIYEKGKACLS